MTQLDENGYKRVDLRCLDGRYRKVSVHRLVATAFLGLDIDDPESIVDHKDDDPSHNWEDNLQVVNTSFNTKKSFQSRFTDSSDLKQCRRCNEVKPKSEFSSAGKTAKTADGLKSYCKPCVKDYYISNVKGKTQ